MPINSINSVSFKSAQDNEHALLYNSDDQMYAAASNGPLHRLSDVSKKTAKTVIIAAPIVDAFLGGAAQNGALTSKLSKSAVILGKWGAMFAVALGVFGIKKAVNNNVKPLKEFDKKHPAMSFVIDFAALFGGLSVLSGFGGKIAEKAKELLPGVSQKFGSGKSTLKNVINKTAFNTKLNNSFDKFMTSHPYHSAALKTVAFVAAPAIAIAALLRLNKESQAAVKNTNENFVRLKTINEFLGAQQNSVQEKQDV